MAINVFSVILIIFAVLIIAALIKAVLGPRFTDRIVAVNCISTMIIVFIIILSFYLKAEYLVDVAIIYALLGFTANLVLTRILLHKDQKAGNDAAAGTEEPEVPEEKEENK